MLLTNSGGICWFPAAMQPDNRRGPAHPRARPLSPTCFLPPPPTDYIRVRELRGYSWAATESLSLFHCLSTEPYWAVSMPVGPCIPSTQALLVSQSDGAGQSLCQPTGSLQPCSYRPPFPGFPDVVFMPYPRLDSFCFSLNQIKGNVFYWREQLTKTR